MKKFRAIYNDLKMKIERGSYEFKSLLPSESNLAEEYGCTRMTARRALFELQLRGYIQTQQGVGARVIWQQMERPTAFLLGEIESFRETAFRNHFSFRTEVVKFVNTVAKKSMTPLTGFAEGTELLEVHRVRHINGRPLILDKNIFLRSKAEGLTPEIAAHSIYEYLEGVLGMKIVTSRRLVTVELANEYDRRMLDLGEFNSLAVISGRTYNSDGLHFEFTQSRHHPDYFCFEDTAIRKAPDD